MIRLLTEAHENRDEVALILSVAIRRKCCCPPPARSRPPAAAGVDALRRRIPWPTASPKRLAGVAMHWPQGSWPRVVVAITDGRGNVPEHVLGQPELEGEEKPDLKQEVLDAARYRTLGIKLLVIDTERKSRQRHGQRSGRTVGKYVQPPKPATKPLPPSPWKPSTQSPRRHAHESATPAKRKRNYSVPRAS